MSAIAELPVITPSERPRSVQRESAVAPKIQTVVRRNLQLDVLRCIAILLVIGAHIKTDNFTGFTGWLARTWQTNGWLGVPIFFALSGYLISGLIFDELRVRNDFRIGRFLIRRGFKLYPSYYLFLAYLVAMPFLKDLLDGRQALAGLRQNVAELLPNLVFIQNYVGTNPALHTWSLAVEEHFYLILPFLMLAMFRRKHLHLLVILGLASPLIFGLMKMLLALAGDPYGILSNSKGTHIWMDGLLMGVGLRALLEYAPGSFKALGRWRIASLIAGVLVLAFGRYIPYVSTPAIGSTLLLLGALQLQADDFGFMQRIGAPGVRLMAWVGMYSYSIYLWHPTFMGIARKKFISHLQLDPSQPLDWFVNRTLIVIGIIAGGWFMARIVEWPVLRFRDRYFPKV
jgi:peptidoglycan/LPS O-acetylase OafA/YrhL